MFLEIYHLDILDPIRTHKYSLTTAIINYKFMLIFGCKYTFLLLFLTSKFYFNNYKNSCDDFCISCFDPEFL